ncbi:MAG: methylthioribose-phosphate isomerase [Myxococcaceae bacterium]|nr:methylthioribose-phosphate isomerase [Myxococcaceae bacterium]
MNIQGKPHRTIGWSVDRSAVEFIDQAALPRTFSVLRATSLDQIALAISSMQVRGAPLIGVAAVYGLALAARADASDRALASAAAQLIETRPTAINLRWAVEWAQAKLAVVAVASRARRAEELASELADLECAIGKQIAEHGVKLIAEHHRRAPGRPVQVMTHCNAGWLATVDWGTALAPVYLAQQLKIPIHVWVSETRPRNQGLLTAFELREQAVPHTVLVDNAAGLLMQRGEIDLVIVGTDRTSAQGDVCNKIGTYLKALAAKANGVPFYAAVPSSSIDWKLADGVKGTPIEQRDEAEVRVVGGVELLPKASPVTNYGFDVTPASLVTGLITERGVCAASRAGLAELFPEHRA